MVNPDEIIGPQAGRPTLLEVDERSLFMGRAKSGLALVSPALQSYIADNLRDSSAILNDIPTENQRCMLPFMLS